MAAVNEEVWPPPRANPPIPPDRSLAIPNSQFVIDSGLRLKELVEAMFDDINECCNMNAKPAY